MFSFPCNNHLPIHLVILKVFYFSPINYEVYSNCSSLKKLAEKGLWDIAEARTNNDKQLLEYLVSGFEVLNISNYQLCFNLVSVLHVLWSFCGQKNQNTLHSFLIKSGILFFFLNVSYTSITGYRIWLQKNH